MKNILPPYGVILRDAITTGDKDLMQAFVKYSDFMMKQDLHVSNENRESWKAAHAELVAASG
ncbi:MAG: hypothetical protein WA790_12125 [Sulfitobacter sp.]